MWLNKILVNGWTWFEMAGPGKHDKNCLKMAGNGWKWRQIAEKNQYMALNDCVWLEMDGHFWKSL